MGEVERRWVGRFFRPVKLSDEERFNEVRNMLDQYHPFISEPMLHDLQQLRRGRSLVVDDDRRDERNELLRWLDSFGIGIDGRYAAEGGQMQMVGIVAEGIPEEAVNYLFDPSSSFNILAGSLFVEALPTDADLRLFDRAAELLPDLPTWGKTDRPPLYDEPLHGPWAEWIEDARATLEVVGFTRSR